MLSKKLMEVKTMATTEFGLRVRTELLKRNITNKQLADMLGISSAYLSDILGRRDAFEQKKRIAKILEIKEEIKIRM